MRGKLLSFPALGVTKTVWRVLLQHRPFVPKEGAGDEPTRPCPECGTRFALRGRYCSIRCKLLAWRRARGRKGLIAEWIVAIHDAESIEAELHPVPSAR